MELTGDGQSTKHPWSPALVPKLQLGNEGRRTETMKPGKEKTLGIRPIAEAIAQVDKEEKRNSKTRKAKFRSNKDALSFRSLVFRTFVFVLCWTFLHSGHAQQMNGGQSTAGQRKPTIPEETPTIVLCPDLVYHTVGQTDLLLDVSESRRGPFSRSCPIPRVRPDKQGP